RAEQRGRQGHPLRVVPARERDDAACSRSGIERRDAIVSSAELEGPDALQILAFEEDRGVRSSIQRTRRDDRRPMRDALEAPRRRSDVYISDGKGTHVTCARYL